MTPIQSQALDLLAGLFIWGLRLVTALAALAAVTVLLGALISIVR